MEALGWMERGSGDRDRDRGRESDEGSEDRRRDGQGWNLNNNNKGNAMTRGEEVKLNNRTSKVGGEMIGR
jgi:hypothetical protein